MNSTQCGFDGNPDIYGAGIRIGYYTQILSVWIANYFVLTESKSLRSVNILFMLALFIGAAWQSRRPSRIYAIEAFLLIELLSATWYIGVLEKSRYSKKYWRFSPARLIFRNLALVGLLAYSVWFWWIGLDLMSPTPCGTWMFFMAKVSLYGWYRSAFKVLSLTAISFHAILTVGHAAQLAEHWRGQNIMNPDYYRTLRQDLLKHESVKRNGSGSCSDPAMNSLHGAAASAHPHQIGLGSSARNSRSGSIQMSVTADQPEPIQAAVPSDAVGQQPSSEENGSPLRETHQITASQPPGPVATQPPSPSGATLSQKSTLVITQPSPPSSLTATATQTPTPISYQSSPPSPAPPTQKPTSACTQSAQPNPVRSPVTAPITVPSFADLLTADAFLANILERTNRPPTRTYQIPHTPISISFPSLHLPSPLPSPHPPLRPLQILTPLLLHTYALRRYPLHIYPSIIHTALLTPQHALLSPLALRTCIAFHVSRLPATNRTKYSFLSAISTLLVVVGLVLAIELSIAWNGIRHTSDVGAVGQLVPAVIGVGGLLKVLWTWWRCGRADGGGLRHTALPLEDERDGIAREAVDCAEVYDRLKPGRAVQDV